MDTLLPCPFCGCNKVTPILDQLESNPTTAYVQCCNCLTKGPMVGEIEDAKKEWNARANNPDTARLDWLMSDEGVEAFYLYIHGGEKITRELIDKHLPK